MNEQVRRKKVRLGELLLEQKVISQEQRQLLPRRWLGLGPFINRATAGCQAAVPADLSHRTAGPPFPDRKFSASILIPCSNERGNIENPAYAQIRQLSGNPIRGRNSSDGTFEECERVRDVYKDSWDIKVLKQDGKGKGDACEKVLPPRPATC